MHVFDHIHLCIVFVVGFEEPEYNISEAGGSLEVCVTVFNPPQEQPLLIDIHVVAFTAGIVIPKANNYYYFVILNCRGE